MSYPEWGGHLSVSPGNRHARTIDYKIASTLLLPSFFPSSHSLRSQLSLLPALLSPTTSLSLTTRLVTMRFALPILGLLAATATAQVDHHPAELLWPTSNNWTVSSIYGETNATTATVGFHLIMELPFNNSMPALHQWCGRSWERGRSLVTPWDWATCEFDRKVAWRFARVKQQFPENFTLEVVYWDALG